MIVYTVSQAGRPYVETSSLVVARMWVRALAEARPAEPVVTGRVESLLERVSDD